MDVPARPFGEPFADQRRLVGGVIVHDEMDVETAWDGSLDLVEELAELGGAVAAVALADDLACRDVQGGEQRGRAVALVVVASPAGWPGRIGSMGWLRSSAWIWDFSSTHRTMAWSGGET